MLSPCRPTWIATSAVALVLLGCRSAPPIRTEVQHSCTVYVVRRSWHIDVGFQATDLVPPLAQVRSVFPSARYFEFGFGDRRYLMSAHHGAGSLLAALWPGAGLVLLTALKATPAEAFGAGNVLELRITAGQSEALQRFIGRSLLAEPGELTPVANGPYEGSVFYAAGPRYSALHTCNTWAAEALHAAQLPIRSTGVEFAGQLWSQALRLRDAQLNDTGR